MKLGWAIYYVPDVAATLAFYEAAFGCTRGMMTEGGEFGTLQTGETTLAFCAESFLAADDFAFEPMRREKPLPAFEIAFVTDDVEGAYVRAVEAGAAPLIAPKAKPWGQIVSYVRDINGFQVEICSPVA
ncbi:MAG: VOC family protein [Proteobacteria bacterium]|nr:VOC family protein [Pseudomonadota bacterium]